MSFEFTVTPPGCQSQLCVIGQGPIEEGSDAALKAFARANGLRPGAVLILDSPGGGTLAGLALGTQIRNLGLMTRVERVPGRSSGACASACAYAFLGGLDRTVAEGAKLGVHQMSSSPTGPTLSAADAQWVTALIALHVDRMGADVTFLTTALRTPPHRLHWFTSSELVSVGAITNAPTLEATRIALHRRLGPRDRSFSMQANSPGTKKD